MTAQETENARLSQGWTKEETVWLQAYIACTESSITYPSDATNWADCCLEDFKYMFSKEKK